jgi:DNA-binding response OmpR family regulator
VPRETCHLLVISADHDLVDSISRPLAADGYTLHWLTHAFAPSTRIFVQNVQAAILDLESGGSSDAVCLTHLFHTTKCSWLALTSRGSLDQRMLALRAGASAVLSRPIQSAELSARMSMLVAYHREDHPAPASFLAPGLILDTENSVLACQEDLIDLTHQEALVLGALAQFTNRMVGHQCLCAVLGLAPDRQGILALRQAIARLRRKLSSHEFHFLHIVAERRHGYSLLVHENQ